MGDNLNLEDLMCKWTTDFEENPKKKPAVIRISYKSNERPSKHSVPRKPNMNKESAKITSTTPNQNPRIQDLCETDRLRIAELIKELGKITAQKEEIVLKMKNEKEDFESKLTNLTSEKQELLHEREKLQEQLTRTQQTLAVLQQQLTEKLQCLGQTRQSRTYANFIPPPARSESLQHYCECSADNILDKTAPQKSLCDFRKPAFPCSSLCLPHMNRRVFTEQIDAELRRSQVSEPNCCSSPLNAARPNANNNALILNSEEKKHCCLCSHKSGSLPQPSHSDCSIESTPVCSSAIHCHHRQCCSHPPSERQKIPSSSEPDQVSEQSTRSTVAVNDGVSAEVKQRMNEVDAQYDQSKRDLLIREREVLERERRCLALMLEQQQLIEEKKHPALQSAESPQHQHHPIGKGPRRQTHPAFTPAAQRSRVLRPRSPHSLHSVVIRPGVLNPSESRPSSKTPSSLCESVNIQLPETEEETTTVSPHHFVRNDRYARRPGRSPPSPPSSILDIVESMNDGDGNANGHEMSDQEDEESRLLEDVFFVRLL